MQYSRKLLDDLMGPDRDEPVKMVKNYNEDNVCKDYLVAFCPNELFVNTKSDMGQCYKIHDDRLRGLYQADPEHKRHGYEEKFFRHLEYLVRELDRKIARAQDRIDRKGVEMMDRSTAESREERQEKIIMLEEKIKLFQERIEVCGEEGEVDEAKELQGKVETYGAQLASMKVDRKEKQLQVCIDCASILLENDIVERVKAHFEGKQHTGYVLIRETYEKLKAERENGPAPGTDARGDERRRDDRPPHRDMDRASRDYPPRRDDDRRRDDRPRGGYDDRRRDDHRGGYGGDRRRDDGYRRERSPPRRDYR